MDGPAAPPRASHLPRPRSLLGRTLLVLLLGVLASNLVGIAVYSGDRLDVLMRGRGRQVAEQVATAAAALAGAEPEERRRLARAMRQPGLRLYWTDRPQVSDGGPGQDVRMLREAFLGELDVSPEKLRLTLTRQPPGELEGLSDAGGPRLRGPQAHPPGPPPLMGSPKMRTLSGSLLLDDGSWLNFSAPIASFPPFWATPYFLVLLGSTAIILAVSIWAVRRAVQPLAMFADAAERLGRDMDASPLRDDGPREVRRAALAFNEMQKRLRAFVRDRTQMLAAISHDLRTPLTRLRLRAELIEDEDEQRKMIADLDAMGAMIDAALAFARDEAAGEKTVALDLAVLLQTVCEAAADAGGTATYHGLAHVTCAGRPLALRRAFTNLVDNALIYGGQARVGLAIAGGELIVTVDDDGPGIPADELERVFEPFRRLEASRSRETGGTGLGLALVRAAIAAHGGAVRLANRPDGGLRARVVLPAAPEPLAAAGREVSDTTVSLAKPPVAR